MKTTMLGLISLSLLTGCDDNMKTNDVMAQPPPTAVRTIAPADVGHESLEATIKDWPAKPKEQVMLMHKQYGEPEIVSAHLIAWKDTGPFKFTKIMDKEIAHDFPIPHTDFMEQGVDYKVPADKVGPLAEYDGSVIVDRTKGCLSARCDVQAHNTLALNLAHDVITGKRTPAEARTHFANVVAKEMKGGSDPYMEKLQFSAAMDDTGDKDKSVPATGMDTGKR